MLVPYSLLLIEMLPLAAADQIANAGATPDPMEEAGSGRCSHGNGSSLSMAGITPPLPSHSVSLWACGTNDTTQSRCFYETTVQL